MSKRRFRVLLVSHLTVRWVDFRVSAGFSGEQQNLLSFCQLVLQNLAVKMNYYLNADGVNVEMGKGIRNYTPICHSKFSTKRRRKDRKRKELSTSETHDHHDHRDIY